MPQFAPNEGKVAIATFPVKPAGLACTAELWLGSDLTKVATSGEKPFTSTGASQSINLPITMPGVEGTYPVYLDVFVAGQLIGAYRAIEDVVIAPVVTDRWVSPTGYNDPDNKWSWEPWAYDQDLTTYAYNDSVAYGHYIELGISEPLICSKVRIYAADRSYDWYNPDLAIILYYDGGWHTIFSGRITKKVWVEKSIPAGAKVVYKARIKSNTPDEDLYLYEFQFWGH